MSSEWIRMLLVVGVLVVLVTLACSRVWAGKSSDAVKVVDRETPLDGLPRDSRIMVLLIKNSLDQGFYWLDLDNRIFHLAMELEGNWPPKRPMITWTGSHLVYGSRPAGFHTLNPDGSQQQITEFGYQGQIARNGELILRFKKCDPDETGTGYWLTPLDHMDGPPMICLPRQLDDTGTWQLLKPIWNAHLARADFLASRRRGTGRGMEIESTRLIEISKDGAIREILDLGSTYPDWFDNDLQSSPDGRAFYFFDEASGQAKIFDRLGATLVDLATLDNQLPQLKRTRRFSWSPDGRTAVILFEKCETDEKCRKVLVVLTDGFARLREVATLPADFRNNRIVWSPDGALLAFVTEIHQGEDDPPRIDTVDLADGSTARYIFPNRMIIGSTHWIR